MYRELNQIRINELIALIRLKKAILKTTKDNKISTQIMHEINNLKDDLNFFENLSF